VKPFLKSQKNDFRDAGAVAEGVQRPTMRFVPTKSVNQLDLQDLDRRIDDVTGEIETWVAMMRLANG
jgi:transposase